MSEENLKNACGRKKIPYSVVPQNVMAEVGVAMLEGALKYARHNYRERDVTASIFYDSARRHIDMWWEGEDTDPDSQLSHITKAIASLTVLRDGMLSGTFVDDRPPKMKNMRQWRVGLEQRVGELQERHPDVQPPVTALSKDEIPF